MERAAKRRGLVIQRMEWFPPPSIRVTGHWEIEVDGQTLAPCTGIEGLAFIESLGEILPPVPKIILTEVERFWSHVEIRRPEDCWFWQLKPQNRHFGCFVKNDNGRVLPRTYAYRLVHGEVPYEYMPHLKKRVITSCKEDLCVNPAHLIIGGLTDMIRRTPFVDRSGAASAKVKIRMNRSKHIQRLLAKGELREKDIARMFKVTQPLISYINTGKHWTTRGR